jgi:hypothetical protein
MESQLQTLDNNDNIHIISGILIWISLAILVEISKSVFFLIVLIFYFHGLGTVGSDIIRFIITLR